MCNHGIKIAWLLILPPPNVEGDRGQEPRRTGGGRGREAGAEIKKGIVCCLLLSISQSKTLTWQSFEISIKYHQCLKEILEARKRKFVLGLEKQHYLR